MLASSAWSACANVGHCTALRSDHYPVWLKLREFGLVMLSSIHVARQLNGRTPLNAKDLEKFQLKATVLTGIAGSDWLECGTTLEAACSLEDATSCLKNISENAAKRAAEVSYRMSTKLANALKRPKTLMAATKDARNAIVLQLRRT